MRQPQELKVLFLSKNRNEYADRAADFIRRHFPDSLIFSGNRNTPLPPEVLEWNGDLMISFISSWIYPQTLLDNATYAAINFHPGSPEYPGTGCTNFAIYNGETQYGVTCHHMKATVDSGNIVAVKRFPLNGDDNVFNVTEKCYQLIEDMFYEVMECILQGRGIPQSDEKWARKPYTRKQLNELCEIRPDMTDEEIDKRIRATTFGNEIWAYTMIGNRKFLLQP
jgi:methionyl-tRNA formyltransferase